MVRARLHSLAFALGIASLLALVGAGLYRSVAVGRRPLLERGYGDYVNQLARREEWPAVVRQLRLSASLDLGESRVESEIIPKLIQLSRRIGDRESELFGWRKLAERRPSDPSAHDRLAFALLSAEEVGEQERREAALHSRIALSLDPGSATAHWSLGRVALLEGRREEAFAHWDEASRLDRPLVERLLAQLRASDPELADAMLARPGGAGRP